MEIRTTLSLALIACSSIAIGQEIHFKNPNQSLISLNPAFAGSNGGIRSQFGYREQWPQVSGSHNTIGNVFDMAVGKRGGFSLGAFAENQMSGVSRFYGYTGSWSQYFRFCEDKIELVPSAQVMVFDKHLDASYMEFGRGFVWNGSPRSGRKTNVSMSAGFVSRIGQHITVGSYFFHLNKPDEGLLGADPMETRSVVHGSYTFFFGEKHLLQLFGAGTFGKYTRNIQFTANSVLYKHLIVGAGYGSGDVMQLNAGYHSPFFNVVLGYDRSVSRLAQNTGGSWEVLATFNLKKRADRDRLVAFERM